MRTNFNSRTSQEVRLIEVKGNRAVIDFNSRTSQEVRRCNHSSKCRCSDISTHVPHKRYDWVIGRQSIQGNHFNSRTSQEVQQAIGVLAAYCGKFQLTYLTRGTTQPCIYRCLTCHISTHVPHKRYDCFFPHA